MSLEQVASRSTGPKHWRSLDVLRAIAVLLVLGRHHTGNDLLHRVGWIGVDLFFVLSGFLVSGLVFDEVRRTGTFRPWRFLVRRGFKIYPSFYVLIVVSAVYMYVTGWEMGLMNHLAELFFFQSYHEALWPHTWSLAVEEHFYFLLVVAVVVLLLARLRLTWKWLVLIAIGVFVCCLSLRILALVEPVAGIRFRLFATHLRLDSMMAGVLLAAWYRYRPISFKRTFHRRSWFAWALMLLGLTPALLHQVEHPVVTTVGFTGLWVAGAIAVGMAVLPVRKEERGVFTALLSGLAWIGGISYTTYLWHMFVLVGLNGLDHTTGWSFGEFDLLVYAVISVAVGWFMSLIVERPFLKIRERYFPRG